MQKGKFILVILILFVVKFSIAQTQEQKIPFYCNGACCHRCDVWIADARDYDKFVFRICRKEEKQKKKKEKIEKKYSCFHISHDYTYSLIVNQNPNGSCLCSFIITNKNVINYLLPLFPNNIKKEILYSYSDNRDTIFKDLIEYEHKTIVNDRDTFFNKIEYDNKTIITDSVFYYPLRDTTLRYAVIFTAHFDMFDEFIELLKQEDILKDYYLIDVDGITAFQVFIPLIDTPQNNEEKTKKAE